jgi:hypothetical protein
MVQVYGKQYPEVGYWILRWDTRTLNPGIPVGYWKEIKFQTLD